SFWGPAKRREEEGTQLHTHWHVTNISDRNFLILKARVAGYEAESSHVLVAREDTLARLIFGRNPITAHHVTEMTASFLFLPIIRRDRGFIVADMIFTDNYGDEHLVSAVRVRHVKPPAWPGHPSRMPAREPDPARGRLSRRCRSACTPACQQ